ncbi:glycerophosphoryl diester phosphodiesterase [Vallitalea longa]|uniref:Glycerophosphoryl diester phosphodiesterase n=1 Tax=Vallitalea longa TaxID=2936439 RepID=A0A9W5YCA6_9FIRM|nr:glycerophosphodiester phosphodiesterase [Vallitalea longa]GKX29921.1 glycerophosphoryl diester phosphodiesterase [Vallitalea longa]
MNCKKFRLEEKYKSTFTSFKRNFWSFIKYQIVAKVLVTIVLIPIFKELFKLILKSKGLSILLNGVILKFVLSPQGFISAILITIFATLVLLIEYGGIIIISYEASSNKHPSTLFNVLKLSIKRFKNLLGFGGLTILTYVVIIFPWLDMGYHTSLLTSLQIPNFIRAYINNNQFLYVTMKIGTVIVFILSIGFIFSMEIIMLENKSALQAMKKSFHLVKNNFKLVIKSFVITIVLMIVVSLGIFGSIAISFPMISLDNSVTNILINGVVLFLGLFLYLISFLIIPYIIHHFTCLYLSVNSSPIDLSIKTKVTKLSIIDKVFNNKKAIKILITLSFCVVLVITKYILADLASTHYHVEVTAHRGSSIEAPENTLSAIGKAIENKADFVEIDVQETKDGVVVVYHDKSLKRITGSNKKLYNTNYDEIKQLDAGSWFGKEFKGEKIPTLKEVIDYSRGKISLNIELKQRGKGRDLVKKVVEIINNKKIVDSCVVTSLDYDLLKQVERLNSNIKTGYIMFVAIGDINSIKDVDFYSIEESYLDENFVLKAHLINRDVHVWTVNETEKMKEFIEMGVDNIITDYDKQLVKVLKAYN